MSSRKNEKPVKPPKSPAKPQPSPAKPQPSPAKPANSTPPPAAKPPPPAASPPPAPPPPPPNPPTSILIVDDDDGIRYSLRRALDGHGYAISEASSGEAAVEIAPTLKPHVILLDNRMEGMSGIETILHLHSAVPDALIIFMTAFGTTQTTIDAMKHGAFETVMKPFETAKVLEVVAKAVGRWHERADAAKDDYKPLLDSAEYKEGIVGKSDAMQEVIKDIGRVAASNATVLITGESGTGKELVARCIHRYGLRSRGPFHAVNCAAIPENLIESELFGHERGSFTSASAQKIGKFELCNGGTIFLDEIGDMTLPMQTKILRALQEGEIQRVGGNDTVKVDVRLVAATNKDLEKMVAEKTFREDLYYRLNVVRLRLPALRERKEDLPLLVDFMLQRFALTRKTKARRLAANALAALTAYNWPGNVRELENAIYRAAVVARGDTILATDLPVEIAPAPSGTAPLSSAALYDALAAHLLATREHRALPALEEIKNELAARLLVALKGSKSAVAQLLGAA